MRDAPPLWRDELREEFIGAHHRVPSAKKLVFLDEKAWNLTRPKKGERELLGTTDVIRTLRTAGATALVDEVTVIIETPRGQE